MTSIPSTDPTPTTGTQRGIGPLRTLLESTRQTVLMLRYRRVFWYAPIALVLLFVFAFVVAGRAHGDVDGAHLYCVMAWWGLGTVVVPWATLYLGVQAVHGEIEDRTSQYLFLRPVSRVPLLLGKWLAVTLVACLIACAGAGALFAGVGLRGDMWLDGREPALLWSYCKVLSLGVVAYAATAMFFGATFRRPLAWAAFFVVGVQMLAANLPVSAGMRRLTITDPLRRVLLDQLEPSRKLARDLWPAERGEALRFDDLAGGFRLELGSPLIDLLIFTAVCLTLGAWRYARTEYESRNRD
ncbi:MAG: ABC transporter permease [Planctomycetes bacterium]|nr:ABC transporter permease [Planctomycetota bacterium]